VVINLSKSHVPPTFPDTEPYRALKAAMDGLTVDLAREYAPHGVRVVGVAPGLVSTRMWLGPTGAAAQLSALGGGAPQDIIAEMERKIPLGRFATPEEVASAIAFLASPRAGAITDITLRIDGGLTPTL
jgi:NAD(P)-dependent dehydrogenase (short-subunit alcohol dehydrogenase family)